MNDSQHKLDDNEQQDLLDRITQQLREQSIPPLPAHCKLWAPKSTVAKQQHLQTIRLVTYGITAAATLLLGGAYWGWSVKSQNVVVKVDMAFDTEPAVDPQFWALVPTARLHEMQHGLEELAGEIVKLKHQAELLDARSKADSLLEVMVNFEDTIRTIAMNPESLSNQ